MMRRVLGQGIGRCILVLFVLLLFSGVAEATTEYITNMVEANSCYPNSNFGTASFAIVENPLYGGFGCNRWGYIDLLYDNRSLSLNAYQLQTEGYSSNISIYNTTIFNEDTLTWNGKPSLLALLYTIESIDVNKWVTVNFTNVRYIAIIPASEYYIITTAFRTDDSSSNKPYIEYTPPPQFDSSGYIKDQNGNAISGATVTLFNATTSKTAISNSTGYWNLSGQIADGAYSLKLPK